MTADQPLDLAALRSLLEAAISPLPWPSDGIHISLTPSGPHDDEDPDVALIVAAVNALPQLLDRIEELERDGDLWHRAFVNADQEIAAKDAELSALKQRVAELEWSLKDARGALRAVQPSDGTLDGISMTRDGIIRHALQRIDAVLAAVTEEPTDGRD